jgi:amidase
MARRFDDLVHLQNAIVGPSDKIMAAIRPRIDYPAQYRDLSGWRIAVDWGAGLADVIPSVKSAMLKGIERLRAAGCVVDEVDCGFLKDQKFVFMRGLFATSIGTLLEISNSHRDLLSPYMAEVLDLVGPVGPRQAEEAEALLEQLHGQVQRRVFGKGYRVLLMPTIATPLVRADMFKSKENQVDVWTGTGFGPTLTWPWNLLNRYPVVDVPLGVVEDRMPAGMQVIGQTFTDLDTFQFASSWARLRPPLFVEGRLPTFA